MTVALRSPAPRVAELVMDRPDALNALSTGQLKALSAALSQVAADRTVSVVIVTSALERAFCVGADLKERRDLDEAGLAAQRSVFSEAFAALRGLDMPTIAAVDGFALGGGCELALSCDVIVAAAGATFALPEAGLGLVPGCGGTQLLPRRIGPGRAAELIFTGRRVGAEEAYALGLVDRLAERGPARDAALELAATIGAQSPVSLRAIKRALRDGAALGLAEALQVEDAAWREAAFSADRVEGITAFNERRTPRWPSWSAEEGNADV